MPLGRRAANARVSREQLESQRLQYQLEQTLGNVRLDARLAHRNVTSIAQELENHKAAVQQAAEELRFATEQAASGIANSATNTSFLIDDLLRSQESVAIAESRLLRSQTDLSIALVMLKRATGELLQTDPLPQAVDSNVQQAVYSQPATSAYWSVPETGQQTQREAVSVWQE
jgi:outer membrane protein TolC